MKTTDNYYPEKLLDTSDSLDLKGFWRTMVRRKRLILLFVAVMFLLSLIITLLMKPVYRASTLLEIERKIANVSDNGLVNGDDPRDTRDFYQTQYELIKSRSIAKKVIEKLNLANSISNTGVVHQVKSILNLLPENDTPDLETAFIENITITPVNTSRLVLISYDADNPKLAAKIANEIVTTFIERNHNKYSKSTDLAKDYLKKQINDATEQLRKADDAVSKFRDSEDISLLGDDGETERTRNVKQIHAQLIKAEQNKRKIEATLTSEEKKNPSTEYKNAILEEKSLRVLKQKAQNSALAERDGLRKLNHLLKAANASQATYDNLLQRLKQINIASSGNSRISVVDAAEPPRKKDKPKMLLNLFFGSLLGFLLGTAYAFLLEYLDDTITSSDELEHLTKFPTLSIIPSVNDRPSNEIGMLCFHEPHSHFAEAFRTLRTSIKFLTEEEETRLIFITSTNSSEGKSTATANLAMTYAQSGRSVLLIDADLRSPSIHKIFQQEQAEGLSELLTGEAEPKDVIKSTDVSDLYLITSGNFTHDPIGLISNLRMEKMLKLTAKKYDHVIIDGPPVLGLADAQILSNLATATIFVMKSGETDKSRVLSSIARIKQAKGNIIGTLMTNVDMEKSDYAYNYLNYSADNNNAPKASKLRSAINSINKL